MTKRFLSISSAFILGLVAFSFAQASEDRPNILWIVSEDNGPFLGSYGDQNASTPNLDRLADQGIRYTNCFANAPVCAVARSSWIFGVPAVSTGTLHMRSKYLVPRDRFRTYPELLKAAGYYVTNNTKTDYNTNSIDPNEIWDESSGKAHYKNRPEGSPFFAIFNIGQSHESGIFPRNHPKDKEPRVAAEAIEVPPYQIATPAVVRDWQLYYDRMELMDEQVGKLLAELAASGEADNTIIVYCSDHGGVTLRSKRFLHDSGTRVPLIAYFPDKFKDLAPAKPGSVEERLVQFIDMPKTWLSLTGSTPPDVMPGRVFLGEKIESAPESVFLFSGRFDEAPDNSRAVTDGRWKYIRNYESDRQRFQMITYPLNQYGQVSQWHAFKAGLTNAAQSAQYLPQPAEELYDTKNDPHEINNLTGENPKKLVAMRKLLKQHVLASRDLGFIPEPMMEAINDGGRETIYEFGQSEDNYPLARVLDLATLASTKDVGNTTRFIAALKDKNPIIRYWGAEGLRALGSGAAGAEKAIVAACSDSSASVRIVAAVCLGNLGQQARAIELLLGEAKAAAGNMHATWALDGLKYLDAPEALAGLEKSEIQEMDKGNYSKRVIDILQAGGSSVRMPSKKE